MAQKKKDPSALRRKLIMTDNMVGRVLNDPEKAQFIVLQVLRTRHVRHNDWVAQRCGWSPTSVWWTRDDRTIHTTHAQLGPFEVVEKMPKWLHPRHLNRRSGAPMTTTVNGRTYIDW